MSDQFTIDQLNLIAVDAGGNGGHQFNIDALNEIAQLGGGEGGHLFEVEALNEIAIGMGGEGGHFFVMDALDEIAAISGVDGPFADKAAAFAALIGHLGSAGPQIERSLTPVGSAINAAAGASYTLALPFGDLPPEGQDRIVPVAFAFRSGTLITISSITIGGVAAAFTESRNTTGSVLTSSGIAWVKENTLLNGNFVINFSGSAARIAARSYRLVGAANLAPYLTGSGNRGATAGDMSASLSNYLEDGCVIAAAFGAGGGSYRLSTANKLTQVAQKGATYTATTANDSVVWTDITEDSDIFIAAGATVTQSIVTAGWRFLPVTPAVMPSSLLATGRLNQMGFGASPDSNGVATSSNSRIACFNEVGTGITKLKAVFGNFKANATHEADGVNSITIRAALEYPAGVFTDILFGGVRDKVLAPSEFVDSDEVTIAIPEDTQFWIRTKVTVTSGQVWPTGYIINTARGEGCDLSTSDFTKTGTITGSNRGFGPVSVKATGFAGNPVGVAIATIGDSITAGSGDGVFDSRGYTGWNGRGAYNECPHLVIGYGGTRVADNVPAGTNFPRRMEMLRRAGVTHVVINWGINDLATGRTFAQIQADLISFWTSLAAEGFKVVQCTITPRSTGSPSTVEGQSPLYNANRFPLNDWIRTKPAPLFDIIEMADAVESGRNTGVWGINPAWASPRKTEDNLHPNNTNQTLREGGHFSMADAFLLKIKEWMD